LELSFANCVIIFLVVDRGKKIRPPRDNFGRLKGDDRRSMPIGAIAMASFGTFQEEPATCFASSRNGNEVATFPIQPTQTQIREPDRSTLVRFRAGGLREMAWHLLSWDGGQKIVAPEELRTRMLELVRKSYLSLGDTF
jgi:predicted DNA-binding transcriptional regulator YafY